MNEKIIDVKDLSYRTPKGEFLFEGLSFSLSANEILLITGKNGSGKSTLLQLILGMIRPTNGHIYLDCPKNEIAWVPQLQNIHFALPATLCEIVQISLDRDQSEEKILSLGLLEKIHLGRSWNTASGGEKQRALLTAALLRKPRLLLLDEPLNHLDSRCKEALLKGMDDFFQTSDGKPRGIVMVSHDVVPELIRQKTITLHLKMPNEKEVHV